MKIKNNKKNKPVFTSEETTGQIFILLTAYYFNTAVMNLEGVIKGTDIEYLHNMRVSIRKLRTVLQFFRRCLTLRVYLYFRHGFKWIADFLGGVRDMDVYLIKFHTFLNDENSNGNMDWRDQMIAAASKMLAVRRNRMLRSFQSVRFKRILEKTKIQTADPVLRKDYKSTAKIPTRITAEKIIWKMWENCSRLGRRCLKKLGREEQEPSTLPDKSPDKRKQNRKLDREIHELRISFKKLRYALEFFTPILTEEQKALIPLLPLMQDVLGNYVDTFFIRNITKEVIRNLKVNNDFPEGVEEEIIAGRFQMRIEIRNKINETLNSPEWQGMNKNNAD